MGHYGYERLYFDGENSILALEGYVLLADGSVGTFLSRILISCLCPHLPGQPNKTNQFIKIHNQISSVELCLNARK
jgi:hypothetical protein